MVEGRDEDPASGIGTARAAIAEVEAGLDALPAGGGCALRGGTRDRVASRLSAAAARIDVLRREGLDVGTEEVRLSVCRTRLSAAAAGC